MTTTPTTPTLKPCEHCAGKGYLLRWLDDGKGDPFEYRDECPVCIERSALESKLAAAEARVKELESLLDCFEPRHDATCGIHMDLTNVDACTCGLVKRIKALNL